ncbi:uncharacterized protein PAN0_005d2606 [Moesziomyces antarcticus]|uniref:Uncharacterized protein n=1 Tax=Pseudozyma antarctica TaxID=84753 RepID=A0A081CCJ7_PSEA2|nr:uncharacterized protein PAN0_005d2606 [Moesziomyces antarcticus]GAK64393.1 hypothetical protein PAN0_005d2606 [Moesziomyces antarcticus]
MWASAAMPTLPGWRRLGLDFRASPSWPVAKQKKERKNKLLPSWQSESRAGACSCSDACSASARWQAGRRALLIDASSTRFLHASTGIRRPETQDCIGKLAGVQMANRRVPCLCSLVLPPLAPCSTDVVCPCTLVLGARGSGLPQHALAPSSTQPKGPFILAECMHRGTPQSSSEQ